MLEMFEKCIILILIGGDHVSRGMTYHPRSIRKRGKIIRGAPFAAGWLAARKI